MCGIVGFLSSRADTAEDALRVRVRRMANEIAHRGPDASGEWVDGKTGVALGHRRLSIIDLSAAGAQPMEAHGGRFVIVLNGEIYNFKALRQAIDQNGSAPAWRGHSDTEVLLEAIGLWGVERALRRAVGMFAFALWDRAECELIIARDRLGEKPLYYGRIGGDFVFASELKALRAHPSWAAEIDPESLAELLRFGYVASPHTIYRGICKLIPGTFARVRAGQPTDGISVTPYWNAVEEVHAGARSPFGGSPQEAVDELERLLRDAVTSQMVSDVPLGAFLSGGIDSSTVVALMQQTASRPVRTFTIGFSDGQFDEAPHARAIAQHLGTHHTELYATPEDALAVIPRLPSIYDEPFADSSQIPTYLVCALARRHVTVALSGDAGDELFAGYTRYLWGMRAWRRIGRIPQWARGSAASAVTALSPTAWDALYAPLSRMLPSRWRLTNFGDKVHKLAASLGFRNLQSLYLSLVTQNPDALACVSGLSALRAPRERALDWNALPDPVVGMEAFDLDYYLPDDILTKVDRAAMAVSLETRVPLLDHRVVEFACTLPPAMKIRDGLGKWALRQVLYRHVPAELVDRPKMGFAVPLDRWLRGPLRAWADHLLDAGRLRRQGLIDPGIVGERWRDHLSGRRNHQAWLWPILMFCAWSETN